MGLETRRGRCLPGMEATSEKWRMGYRGTDLPRLGIDTPSVRAVRATTCVRFHGSRRHVDCGDVEYSP
jgi:hypothetical protein